MTAKTDAERKAAERQRKPDPTAAARNKRARERKAAKGLTLVREWVPQEGVPVLKEMAEKLRAEAEERARLAV